MWLPRLQMVNIIALLYLDPSFKYLYVWIRMDMSVSTCHESRKGTMTGEKKKVVKKVWEDMKEHT